VLVVD